MFDVPASAESAFADTASPNVRDSLLPVRSLRHSMAHREIRTPGHRAFRVRAIRC